MSFDRNVRRWARAVRAQIDAVHRGLLTRGLESLTYLTPVDTGRARASWRVGLGRVDRSVDRRPDRGQPGFGAAQTAGDAMLRAQFSQIQRAQVGGSVWLTNDLHYIQLLEYGHSAQSRWMLRLTWRRLIAMYPSIVASARLIRVAP